MHTSDRILTIERTNGDIFTVLYSAEDEELVASRRWRIQPRRQAGRFYVIAGNHETVALHSLIAGPWADHINGDSLDNRRSNLRPADPVGNAANRPPRSASGYKGVTHHRSGRWQAAIAKQYLGLFDTAEQAAAAYNQVALQKWGEFAWLNDVE